MKKNSDTFTTILGAAVGIAAAPAIILYTFLYIDRVVPWLLERNPSGDLWTFLGLIVFGIAWSVFAAFGWKRGNVGLRIGLTLVLWAFEAAVVLLLLGKALLEST